MKNLLIMAMVGACAVLSLTDAAQAGGGGGKQSSKGRVVIQNVEAVAGGQGYAVLVQDVGAAAPANIGELRAKAVFVGPQQTRRTAKLKNGNYTATIIPTALFEDAPDNLPITGNEGVFETREIAINGRDVNIRVGR